MVHTARHRGLRNEYANAKIYAINRMAKYVIGRADASATIPGCLWSAPAHASAPYGTRYGFNAPGVDEQYLPQTFAALYANNHLSSPGWAFGPLGATNLLPANDNGPDSWIDRAWQGKILLRAHP